jgi:hypothetical protein
MGPADEDGLEGSPNDEIPTPEAGDNYVGTSVMLPHGGSLARGRVVRRKRDREGNPSGRANANPVLDTRTYEVEFDDGDVSELTANTIAESMYSMCDKDGNHVLIFDEICDFRRSTTALQKDEQVFSDSRGRQQVLKTTKGWQLCVQWKDESTSWEKLADLKECYPVQVAEWAVASQLDDEPAFNWWVHSVLKKRDRIISLVQKCQTRYLKRTTKFVIELPKTVQQALELDRKNGNTLWADAIAKEM